MHHHHQNRHTGTDGFPGRERTGFSAQPAIGTTVNLNLHFQIVAVVQQLLTDGLWRTLAHVNLRIQTLIQFRQCFGEGQAVTVEQILMLLMLFRQHVQQRGVRLTHVHVQPHAVNLAKRHALQPLVQLTDTVLLALNGFTNNIRHAAGADCQLLFAGGQLLRQTAQFDLHLFDGFYRIVGTDDVLTNTLA